MPKLDGTGPMGKGAITGKGMGNCKGNQQRLNIGYGKGNCNRSGMCNGQGMGFGFRHGQNVSSDTQPLENANLAFLKQKADNMENKLNIIKERISELEKGM